MGREGTVCEPGTTASSRPVKFRGLHVRTSAEAPGSCQPINRPPGRSACVCGTGAGEVTPSSCGRAAACSACASRIRIHPSASSLLTFGFGLQDGSAASPRERRPSPARLPHSIGSLGSRWQDKCAVQSAGWRHPPALAVAMRIEAREADLRRPRPSTAHRRGCWPARAAGRSDTCA